jgi:hypothetical protein
MQKQLSKQQKSYKVQQLVVFRVQQLRLFLIQEQVLH